MIHSTADSILIIDDAPRICALIARTLGELPYRLLTADSVRTGKESLVQINRFRLMVIDLGLPDGNGLEIVDAARRLRPDIPILLMSGYDVAGVNVDFILKPFDPEKLLDRVRLMAK